MLNFAAVGIIGATIMPHGLFIGSALATQDRVAMKPVILPGADDQLATRPIGLLRKFLNLFKPVHSDMVEYSSHVDRPNNSYAFVKAHLRQSVADIVINLLGIAVVINSLYVPSYLVTFKGRSWALVIEF